MKNAILIESYMETPWQFIYLNGSQETCKPIFLHVVFFKLKLKPKIWNFCPEFVLHESGIDMHGGEWEISCWNSKPFSWPAYKIISFFEVTTYGVHLNK